MGLRFAVKDNIDVAGTVSGAGNPDWRAGAVPPVASAPCVAALLDAGASVIGKTVSDELAFSLEGRNAWDGIPVNPACPDRLPGGSSSGSAVAVAGGLADFALGTDTGGSVRVPASFCGVYGFRPTHGRVSVDGVLPLAPSYDTVGWFARDPAVLRRVGSVLLGTGEAGRVERLVWAGDAFDLLNADAAGSLRAAAVRLGVADEVSVFGGEQALFLESYRVVQGGEIWQGFGDWITQARPRFAPDIAARFADAAGIGAGEVVAMIEARARIAARVRAMVAPGTGLIVPSAPGAAVRLDAAPDEIGAFYGKALPLTSIAGHAGLPQVVFSRGCNARRVSARIVDRRVGRRR